MPPMNEQEMHDRVLKLEFWKEQTEKRMDILHQDNKMLNAKLSEISKTIFQIKWLVIGGVSVAVMSQIGIFEFIKKLF